MHNLHLKQSQPAVYNFVQLATRFSLETYFQMVHNTTDRYERPSLHTANRKPGLVTAMGRV